ncbi:MAG: HAD family hydrolase [Desulfuromonadaceae bacterium]|nr:HAD family hydrolase [Desulfuromonadaceae bacterium]
MADLTHIDTVLFDLDGTLLNVDMYQFVPRYLKSLADCLPQPVVADYFAERMIRRTMDRLRGSDGAQTNEEYFCAVAQEDFGLSAADFLAGLACFYQRHMTDLRPLIQPLALAPRLLERCARRGLDVVIATNPVFSRPLVEARLQWGGIGDFPYRWVTSFENSRYCKPAAGYFFDILSEIDKRPDQCLMVGNDTLHDLAAAELGMTTFLVDTWLIERESPFRADFRGSHLDLFRFLGQQDFSSEV